MSTGAIQVLKRRRVERLANVVALLALMVGVAAYAFRNLGNRYFWTDESLTFFTGLGFPNSGQSAGSIGDAWRGVYNFLDPGLFQMLARFWSLEVGSGITTLRVLPFIFLLVYIASTLGVCRLVGAPWFVAAGAAGLMLLENITPYYGVEFRPYSAGLAAAVALPLAALWFARRPDWRRLVVLVLAVAVLGSMQFNTMPVAWGAAAALGVAAMREKGRRERNFLAIGLLATLLWLPSVYVVTRGNPLAAHTDKSLSYISELLLSSMPPDRLLSVVATNLLSPTALPRTVFLVLVPILWWRRWLPSLKRCSEAIDVTLNLLWTLVLCATVATVILAAAGFFPWVLGSRWSISEVGLIALSLAGLAGLLLRTRLRDARWGLMVLVGCSIAAALLGSVRIARYERPNNVDYVAALMPQLLEGKPGGSVVDSWLFLDTRYWMEYSGEFEGLRREWISQDVRSSEGLKAGPEQVEAFLSSNGDRMLLRGASVLDQLPGGLPEGVRVVRVPPAQVRGPLSFEVPVLLVKGGAS